MSRSPRPLFSALLCAAFLVETTGAADIAMMARGGMLPPPGAMAPMALRPGAAPLPVKPAPAKPARESWFVSARVVTNWLAAEGLPSLVRDLDGLASALDSLTGRVSAPAYEDPSPEFYYPVSAVLDMPQPEDPLRDRMMIAMEGRRVVASGMSARVASILQYRSELKPYSPRFTGYWVGKGAVRARVDYLNPFGLTRGEAKGYRVKLADGFERLLPSRKPVPESLMKDVPLYFAGDIVEVELTLQNTTAEPLTGLRMVSVQEEYDALGREAAPLSAPTMLAVPDLAPGESRTLRWSVKLSSTGDAVVNFEQTHLKVLGKDPAGSEKILLNENHAGVVDPPAL